MSIHSYVKAFTEAYHADPEGRNRSYDHCRAFFIENRGKTDAVDLMALHLFAFLASWGMLRNSFIMQKDYTFHRDVVNVLFDSRYDSLLGFDPFKDDVSEEVELIFNLKGAIAGCYINKEYYIDGKDNKKQLRA